MAQSGIVLIGTRIDTDALCQAWIIHLMLKLVAVELQQGFQPAALVRNKQS